MLTDIKKTKQNSALAQAVQKVILRDLFGESSGE